MHKPLIFCLARISEVDPETVSGQEAASLASFVEAWAFRFRPRPAVRSATSRGRCAIYRVPSKENRETRAACPGVRRRISASPWRSRSSRRSAGFGSSDPTPGRSDVLLPDASLNAFPRGQSAFWGQTPHSSARGHHRNEAEARWYAQIANVFKAT